MVGVGVGVGAGVGVGVGIGVVRSVTTNRQFKDIT